MGVRSQRKAKLILGSEQLDEETRQVLHYLNQSNAPPVLFQRGARLVRTRQNLDAQPVIEDLTLDHLVNRMGETIRFLKALSNGELVDRNPPKYLARNVMAERSWPSPGLLGVVETPVLRRDGSVLDKAGYDPQTQLIYSPTPGFQVPAVAYDPSASEVRAAVTLIADVFQDFPFLSTGDKANCWAALLTPIVRPAISGCIPMCVFDSPRQGTGKSLLANIIAVVATGQPAHIKPIPGRDGEEEWRKRITSELRQGPSIVVLDNADRPVRSGALAAVLTSTSWGDRVLGVSEMVTLPALACWHLTGNNVVLSADMARRTYSVRIDATVPDPHLRSGFKHPDLMGHVIRNRASLVWASLTLARSWYSAGCPAPSGLPTLGNYVDWVHVLGGILERAGIPGFLDNLAEGYERTDLDSDAWAAFFAWWFTSFGDTPMTTKELVRKSSKPWGSLEDNLPDYLTGDAAAHSSGLNNKLLRNLGFALRQHKDRVWPDGLVLRRVRTDRTKVAQWQVVRTS